jgi:hypothetical protein
MRRYLVILAALSVATSTMAFAANPDRSGLYEDVRISEVTGDEGGVRIRVNDGPSPTVDFALCEGSCLTPLRFPAEIAGDRLSFTYVERATDLQGRPGDETRARVEGRFVPKGLLLKIDFADNPHDDDGKFLLIPRVK